MIAPFKLEFAKIVEEIKPIESGYSARIYDDSREKLEILGSSAAWPAIPMATLGLEKMPRRQKKALALPFRFHVERLAKKIWLETGKSIVI